MELAVRLSLLSRRSLYRRADGIKRSHSTRIQWALRALSSRVLLMFSFFFSFFFLLFSLFSDREFGLLLPSPNLELHDASRNRLPKRA